MRENLFYPDQLLELTKSFNRIVKCCAAENALRRGLLAFARLSPYQTLEALIFSVFHPPI